MIVDLMGNDVWSDADILNRTEAMVRSEISREAETILNRKLQGVAFGLPLSAEDQAEIERFRGIVLAAQDAGVQAKADMTLLAGAMDYEAAQVRLALPAVTEPATILTDEGEVPNPAIAADEQERAAAQAVIVDASAEVLALVAQRAPVPEPEPEPEGEPQ